MTDKCTIKVLLLQKVKKRESNFRCNKQIQLWDKTFFPLKIQKIRWLEDYFQTHSQDFHFIFFWKTLGFLLFMASEYRLKYAVKIYMFIPFSVYHILYLISSQILHISTYWWSVPLDHCVGIVQRVPALT